MIDWKKFWKQTTSFLLGMMQCAYYVATSQLGRVVLLYVLRRYAPALFGRANPALAERFAARLRADTGKRPQSIGYQNTQPVADAVAQARKLGLVGPPGMYDLPLAVIDKNWNGMGPDSWSAAFRARIDRVAKVVWLCSLPHDLWYALYCDGTRATWERTMAEWETINSPKCVAAANIGANWWQRHCNEFVAAVVIADLHAGAWPAWQACYARQHPAA
jgi:hypothetical protein